MIELKVRVSEVDYEAAIRALIGGGMAGNAAALALRALSEQKKEEMAVKYINNSANQLTKSLEDLAAAKGIGLKVTDAEAKVV